MQVAEIIGATSGKNINANSMRALLMTTVFNRVSPMGIKGFEQKAFEQKLTKETKEELELLGFCQSLWPPWAQWV